MSQANKLWPNVPQLKLPGTPNQISCKHLKRTGEKIHNDTYDLPWLTPKPAKAKIP